MDKYRYPPKEICQGCTTLDNLEYLEKCMINGRTPQQEAKATEYRNICNDCNINNAYQLGVKSP